MGFEIILAVLIILRVCKIRIVAKLEVSPYSIKVRLFCFSFYLGDICINKPCMVYNGKTDLYALPPIPRLITLSF